MYGRLLALDIDGTLLGDSRSLDSLNLRLEESRRHYQLCYATGRTLESTLAIFAKSGLTKPNYLVTSVGSRVWRPDPWLDRWIEDEAWGVIMQNGWEPKRISLLATEFPRLSLQPPICQSKFKLSYTISADHYFPTIPLFEQRIKQLNIQARLIYSSGRDLDIVPVRSGKGLALAYLAGTLNLKPEQVFACGNSCNDLDMLASKFTSACVGNSDPELVQALPSRVYIAREKYAAGVQEALVHYGWL